jgi:hypothetical protein
MFEKHSGVKKVHNRKKLFTAIPTEYFSAETRETATFLLIFIKS